VFGIALNSNETVFGRVILDVDEQCLKPRRVLTSSPLTFFKGGQLVEVSSDEEGRHVIIGGVFVFAPKLPKLGERSVDVKAVDFPWALSIIGMQPHLYWGELTIPLAISEAEAHKLEVPPMISPASALVELALGALGRLDELDRSRFKKPEMYAPGRNDLRFSEQRARIDELVGKRILGNYYDTAYAYGFDLRRFYDPAIGGSEVLLCPYCRSIFDPSKPTCSGCDEPTDCDAPFETTVQELAISERKPCRQCKAPLVVPAVLCRWCRARQS
jgi:hypothetical protein